MPLLGGESMDNGVKYILAMPREDFHKYVIKGICKKTEFGHLVVAGAKDLDDGEKAIVTELLRAISPEVRPESDSDLDELAAVIADRSVRLV